MTHGGTYQQKTKQQTEHTESGQKNNVQVYKLITQNSIEEKIYELQERKSKLAENMLDTSVTFVNKLSKEDIMQLFRTIGTRHSVRI